MKKEILTAIKNNLKVKVDRANYGVMSREKLNDQQQLLLYREKIEIYFERRYNGVYNAIAQNGRIIGIIKQRYATKKINGMYKQLQPIIEWIAGAR